MKTKQCSICGIEKDLSNFTYGNREDRSYCSECNSKDQSIYQREGLDAVRKWRDDMRKSWHSS